MHPPGKVEVRLCGIPNDADTDSLLELADEVCDKRERGEITQPECKLLVDEIGQQLIQMRENGKCSQ
jgi:hypothetical protein